MDSDQGRPAPAPAPGGVLHLLDRIDAVIGMGCKLMVVAVGTTLLVLLFVNVVSRYAFNLPLGLIGEIPELLFPWMIMAGVVLAAQSNSHIAVDVLVSRLPQQARRLVALGVLAVIVVTYSVITKVAIDVAEITALEKSPILKIPGSIGYYALALGSILLVVVSVMIALRVLITGQEPKSGGIGEATQ